MSDTDSSSGGEYEDEISTQSQNKKILGLGTKLKLKVDESKYTGDSNAEQQEKELLGKPVTLVVHMPDGTSTKKLNFFEGHCVENIKQTLSDDLSLDYSNINLFLNNKIMADPLSLRDIAELSTDKVNGIELRFKDSK